MASSQSGKLIVLDGDTWTHRLTNRADLASSCLTAASIEEFSCLFEANFGCIGILDVDARTPQSILHTKAHQRIKIASLLSQNDNGSLVFAVMRHNAPDLAKDLLTAGFAAVFYSVGQHARLADFVSRHRIFLPKREAAIEETVTDNLPWNP